MPSVYNVRDGETIFDIVLNTYGTPELLYKLISDNQQALANNNQIDLSIDYDFNLTPGLSLLYDETLNQKDNVIASTVPSQVLPSNTYTVQEGQNIFDIALMVYGNIEKAVQVILDLNTMAGEEIFTLNENRVTGKTITFNADLVENKTLIEYLEKNNLIINTGDPQEKLGNGYSSGFRLSSFY